jgi:hypothetical protein
MVENPDLFVGHHSLRSFVPDQVDPLRVQLLVTLLEIAFGYGHMCGHLSLEPLWLLWDSIKLHHHHAA